MHFDGFRQMSITAGTKGSGRLVFDSSGTKGSDRLIFVFVGRGKLKIGSPTPFCARGGAPSPSWPTRRRKGRATLFCPAPHILPLGSSRIAKSRSDKKIGQPYTTGQAQTFFINTRRGQRFAPDL